MGKWSILIVIMLGWACPKVPAQNPYIKHYTTEDGLPSNMVYDIFQDSRKFIWFATDAGVTKYDGTTFTNYRKKDGLSSNEVLKIKEDSFGRIWFFHLNSSMDFFSRNKIHNSANTPFLAKFNNLGYFVDFFEDTARSVIFFNKRHPVYILSPENRIDTVSVDRRNWFDFIRKYSSPVGSTLYVTDGGSGDFLFWTPTGIIKYIVTSSGFEMICDTLKIKKVFPAGNGMLYLVTTLNKVYLVAQDARSKPVCLPGIIPELQNINCLLKDRDSNIWIVTFDKGVYVVLKNGMIRHFMIREGQKVMQDHENNIWISSMNEGVFRISPLNFIHRHYPPGDFQNLGVLALGKASADSVWMTNGKSVFLFRNKTLYPLAFNNEKYTFNRIRPLDGNRLLIGEKSFHFMLFNGIHFDKRNKQLRYMSVSDTNIQFKNFGLSKNTKEVCSYAGTSAISMNADLMFKSMEVLDVTERVFFTYYNARGDYVVNASKNYLLRDRVLVPYRELARFNNKIITDHINLVDSAEIFNIEGDSIFLMNGSRFYNLSNAFSLPVDQQIRRIINQGTVLYMSTSGNAYQCEQPLSIIKGEKPPIHQLDIYFRNIHDILVCNDSLYVASDDGLTIIPESWIGKETNPVPIPYFKSVFLNDQEIDPDAMRITERGLTKIAFSMGSINFSAFPVQYAYKMEGLDTAWTIGTSGNVVYQRLVSGNYTFRLKVRKAGSGWSEVIGYPMIIRAPIWRHPLFFAFIAVVLLALVAVFILRRKNNQLKRRELDHHLVALELKSLQSMMNPHFIFNALGSIQNFLFQNKTGEAGLYLSQFARLIRQNMNALNTAQISLDEEVDRLKNYLDLERLRMGNKFDYRIETADDLDPEDVVIPAMIIQPFVENSIWHGIASLDEKGFISIRFSKQDDRSINVLITDNGIGISRAKAFSPNGNKHLHLGMEMTRKRLELLGRKYAVQTLVAYKEAFPGDANPGTCVELIVPLSEGPAPD